MSSLHRSIIITFLVQLISRTNGASFSFVRYVRWKFRILQRFALENPCIPENSFCRSFAKVSTIALPQPSFSCFATIDLPMSQYKFINSLFTDLRASYWALYMRSFISLKNVLYSAFTMADISFPPFHNCNLLWCEVVEFIYHLIDLAFQRRRVGIGVFLLCGEDLVNEGDEGLIHYLFISTSSLFNYLYSYCLNVCVYFIDNSYVAEPITIHI